MKIGLAFALAFLAASPAAAQDTQDTVELRELVVSATRLPMERNAVATSVTVLRASELRVRGVRTVAEALRTVSGATLVQSGSYGAFASMFFRGGESDYVQVLIDGVQVNSPGEHFDFANLTLEDIERIEIVRGPVSVLYGSDAVTGVVQLFTRAGAARTRFDFSAAGGLGNRVGASADGSFGSGSFSGELRGRSGNLGYAAGVSHFRSAGAYAFNNEHDNTGATARVSLAVDPRTSVAATVRFSRNAFHYPTDGTGALADTNTFHVGRGVTAGLDFSHRLAARLDAHLQLGFNRNEDRYDDSPDGAADTLGFYAFYSDERFQREAADLRFNYTVANATVITVGGEYERQRERGANLSESEFGPFPGASADRRWNRALYGQAIAQAGRFNLQGGARLEDNQRFGSHATYRGGITARISNALRARASAGTGFKEPRFYEQFATGFVKGNRDLEPETSRSVDAGVDFTRGRSGVSATWFKQHFRNLIQYVGVPTPADAPNYMNLGAARANGLELEAMHARGPLSARASYTHLDTRVTDAGVGDDPLFLAGHKLIRRPKHNGSLLLSYAAHSWIVSTTLNYVGRRDDLDFNTFPATRVVLDAYTRVDVAAELPLNRSALRGTLKLENALNESYEEAFNFPARGRVVFLGVRYVR